MEEVIGIGRRRGCFLSGEFVVLVLFFYFVFFCLVDY